MPGPVRRFIDKSGHSYLRLILLVTVPAIIWFGVFGLIGSWRIGPIEQTQILMATNQAILLIVSGVLLTVARLQPRFKRLLSLSVMVMALYGCVASHLWLDWRAQRFGFFEIALFMTFLSGFIMLTVRSVRGPLSFRPGRSSVLTAVIGTLLSVFATYVLIERDVSQIQERAQTRADLLRDNVATAVLSSMGTLERLKERWGTIDQKIPSIIIQKDFDNIVQGFAEFERLTYLDASLNALYDSKESVSQRQPELERALLSSQFREFLMRALRNKDVHLSAVSQLWGDPNIGFMVAAIYPGIETGRLVVATVNLNNLVKDRLSTANLDCCYEISSLGHVLYQNPVLDDHRVLGFGTSSTRMPSKIDLDLKYWDVNATTRFEQPLLPEGILLFGLAFTFLSMSSQRLTHVARRRAIQLQHNALHDPLTGLPNRRMLVQKMHGLRERCARDGSSLSVIFFELDGLRLASDSLGHEAADKLLVLSAKRFQKKLPKHATLARLDAGSFVLCVSGLTEHEVECLAQNMVDAMNEPLHIDTNILRVTASAGITRSVGERTNPMQLVRQADLAMLQARKKGHAAWCHYSPELNEQVHAKLSMFNDLQSALDNDSIELHYQPIIDGQDGSVVSFEVLMRLPHPVLGDVSPVFFIPIAEESGQIIALTDKLLARACQDAKKLESEGFGSVPISINISPKYFQCLDFVDRIREALAKESLEPARIRLEITESVLLDDVSSAITKLKQLRAIGVHACLDDFGTGYSGLSYLHELPISVIKIDRIFVTNVMTEPTDAAIVRGVTAMAHHMHLKVVVEGVETIAQFRFLKRTGCDLFQGYLFDRPKPLPEVIEKLHRIGLKRDLPPTELIDTNSERRVFHPYDIESAANAQKPIRRALLVGPERWCAYFIDTLTQQRYEILVVHSGAGVFEQLAQLNVDLMILRSDLPDMNALQLLSKVVDMYPGVTQWVCTDPKVFESREMTPQQTMADHTWPIWPDKTEMAQAINALISERAT